MTASPGMKGAKEDSPDLLMPGCAIESALKKD